MDYTLIFMSVVILHPTEQSSFCVLFVIAESLFMHNVFNLVMGIVL
jgi:hypothetical protein